jgi:hypothetical protein
MIGERGGWKIDFDPSSARLMLSHDSGADVSGELAFRQEEAAWRIDLSRDGVEDRLALIDTDGDVQGYLNFVAQGARLEVLVHHRAAQSYGGTLHFRGDATLGRSSFACRTTAPVAKPQADDLTVTADQVVQLASGPADSGLNDTLFDVAADVALHFGGATVDLKTRQKGRNEMPVFALSLTARVDDAGCSALIFELMPDYFRSRYIPYYTPINRERRPRPPTGWMSWNVYFDRAGAAENLAEARIGSAQLRPFGLEIWSIESWQGNSDHLPVSNFHLLDLSAHETQFPAGMKQLADDIRGLGFSPGIWTVPFGTGNAVFYAEHRSWFLHDDQGEPFRNWCGRYLLDPSQPEVRDYMCEMHRVMQEEWGYEFFKIDGMSGRHHSYSAHTYERDEVRRAMRDDCPNPFERCVQALREGIGADSTFLACQGHYTGPEAGLVDAVRIGADIVAPNRASNWNFGLRGDRLLTAGSSTRNSETIPNIRTQAKEGGTRCSARSQNVSGQQLGEPSSLAAELLRVGAVGVHGKEVPEVVILLEPGLDDSQFAHPGHGIPHERVPVRVQGRGDLFGQEFPQLPVEHAEVPDRSIVVGLASVQLGDQADRAGLKPSLQSLFDASDLRQRLFIHPPSCHHVVGAAVRRADDHCVNGHHGHNFERASLQHADQ